MYLVVSGAGLCLQITEIHDFADDEGNTIVSTVRNVGGTDNDGCGDGDEDNFANMLALFTLIA